MAFDCHTRKKPLLYADLFKRSAEKDAEDIAMSNPEGSSSISSASSHLSSPCGSSSSGFSTPLYSDFESEDGDFIAELTRQMAERMLEEDDEEEEKEETVLSASGSADKIEWIRVGNSTGIDSREFGIDSGRVGVGDRNSPIQVFEVKNQPPATKEDQLVGERRVQSTETGQKAQRHQHRQMRYRKRNGSGMQAVFLGGSGSGNGPSGTGVFLPRLSSDPAELKKKSGCSIVLMPTRVLQTLDLHFKQRQQAKTLPVGGSGGSHTHALPKLDESNLSNGHSELEKGSPDGDEMQLPQEWTY